MLLAEWRADRSLFRATVEPRGASDLLALLAAVLPRTNASEPPLVSAVRAAAGRADDAAALLRNVLACIVEDRTVDLADPRLRTSPSTRPEGMPRRGAGAQTEPAIDEFGDIWVRAARVLDGEGDIWGRSLDAAISESPSRVAALLSSSDDLPARVARLVAATGPTSRMRLIEHLRPGFADREMVALDMIWSARTEAPRNEDPEGLWQFAMLGALGYLPLMGGISGLVRQGVAWLATPDRPERELCRHLIERLESGIGAQVPAAVPAVVGGLRALLGAAAEPSVPTDAPTDVLRATRTAGLVIVAPFLPVLFERLELIKDARFRRATSSDRALDVLHALAHGRQEPRTDDRPLERSLCGIPLDERLRPPLPLEPDEAGMVDDLLRSIIERWPALGTTSVDGLRDAFLRRQGYLRPREGGIGLEVAPRTYDMLLDRLPWSISLVKLPWMTAPIHVDWRN